MGTFGEITSIIEFIDMSHSKRIIMSGNHLLSHCWPFRVFGAEPHQKILILRNVGG